MALLYILGGMGILLIHLADVPKAFWLILESAFTPTAAVGGFAGATVKDALRYGIARGLYSNDAGTGYGIIAHASARTDHPVRQASWGVGGSLSRYNRGLQRDCPFDHPDQCLCDPSGS